jgi:hypothetical protein
MAKLSLILREQKRRKSVAKFAGKRKALFEIINDAKASDEDGAVAQPLRADRTSARLLPQVRAGAQQVARNRDARGDPGPHEVELVTRR